MSEKHAEALSKRIGPTNAMTSQPNPQLARETFRLKGDRQQQDERSWVLQIFEGKTDVLPAPGSWTDGPPRGGAERITTVPSSRLIQAEERIAELEKDVARHRHESFGWEQNAQEQSRKAAEAEHDLQTVREERDRLRERLEDVRERKNDYPTDLANRREVREWDDAWDAVDALLTPQPKDEQEANDG